MRPIEKQYQVEEFVADKGWTERCLRNKVADSMGADHNLRYDVLVREPLGGNVDDNIPVAIVLS